MSFVFEKVGDQKDLWKEIGFRDLESEIIPYSKYHLWCADKRNNIYLFNIGNNRGDNPNYYDLSYKMRIIRIAVVESIETGESKAQSVYNIQKISIPRPVWEERAEILKNIEESIDETVRSLKLNVKVNINCDPECVETDYNGR